jgi:hypothetical protein
MSDGPSLSHRYARAMSDEVLQRLQLLDAVPHRGESGRARENVFRDFLRRLIPPDIGIDTGFVVDSAGGVSRQIDIVLYRTDYYPIFEIGGVKHFMAESVIAVFEVKASLRSRDEVLAALANLESVKVLDRTGGGGNYNRDLPLVVDTESGKVLDHPIDPDVFHSQVFAGVITERTPAANTLMHTVHDFIRERPRRLWPNIYVAVKDYTLSYATPNGVPTEDPTVADRMALADPNRDQSEPPLVNLARALADILRVSIRIDFNPNKYFPLTGYDLLESELPDEYFPGRQEIRRLGENRG